MIIKTSYNKPYNNIVKKNILIIGTERNILHIILYNVINYRVPTHILYICIYIRKYKVQVYNTIS